MTTPTAADALVHRQRLVQHLTNSGLLTDETWRRAFLATPRHAFLPQLFPPAADGWRRVTPETAGLETWLRLAYQDTTSVVRLTGPHARDGEPASSCLQPSLAARMLTTLIPADGAHVLEIGTGTGYLTALLCHRLGDTHITSIDIDPDLIDEARGHLHHLGHHPHLGVADGAAGYLDRAPYDHILATATVPSIPPNWLAHTRPGGTILAPLRRALVHLTVTDSTHATGAFLPQPVHILPLRNGPSPHPPGTVAVDGPPERGRTPSRILHDDDFRFYLDITNPDIDIRIDGPLSSAVLTYPDGSCARVTPLGDIQQTGPRRLWDHVEEVFEQWEAAGRPAPDRFLLQVNGNEHHLHFRPLARTKRLGGALPAGPASQ